MSTVNAIRVHIRWMIRKDLSECLLIDKLGFSNSWNEERLLRELRNKNVIGSVAEFDNRVVGFIIYGLHKKFLSVVRLAVHPDFRRRSVGAKLLGKLKDKLSSYRRTFLRIRVHEDNLDAQVFLRSVGFRCSKIIKDHYGKGKDSYSMRFDHSGIACL